MPKAASKAKEEQRMRKSQKGFSLIELLIVVAIILIIAAIAIPNLLRSRIAANEAAAIGALRTIITGQVTYAGQYPLVGYAATLLVLGPPPVAPRRTRRGQTSLTPPWPRDLKPATVSKAKAPRAVATLPTRLSRILRPPA